MSFVLRFLAYAQAKPAWFVLRRPNYSFFVAPLALMWIMVTVSIVGAASSSSVTPSLTTSLGAAVPNQQVVLMGTGFTKAVTPGGAVDQNGHHQITGIGASHIFVAGIPLTGPNVSYPVTFDSEGNFAIPITIPELPEVASGSTITIQGVDDQGLTASTPLNITPLSLSVTPTSSSRNTDILVTGQGFPVAVSSGGALISLSYGGIELALVSSNISGGFEFTMRVPITAQLQSNMVRATRVGYIYQFATAPHTVPAATISLSPTSGAPGETFTISGENFPANSAVSGAKMLDNPILNPPTQYTDKDGRFTASVSVPSFPPGPQSVSATAGELTASTAFTVLKGEQPELPAPPPRQDEITQAMDSLTLDDNLIRVWHFDNYTKEWAFFDPREAFTQANTIKNMVAGQVYWLRVTSPQSALFNNKSVALSAGWNLVPW